MKLPRHTRAAALAAALATTAVIVTAIAEIGHPPPQGQGMMAWLQVPVFAPAARVRVAQAAERPVEAGLPRP